MKICSAETPQAAADHLRPWFGLRFAATVTGGDGTAALAHIIHAAVEAGTPLHRIAAYSSSREAARRLRELVGSFWPEEPLHDLFEPGMSGTPLDAAAGRRCERLDQTHTQAADEFADLIKHVGEIGEDKKARQFLNRRRADVRSVIRDDIERRMRGDDLPMIAWFHEIADFYRDYKHIHKLVDIADLYVEPLQPMVKCALLILDDIEEPRDRALLLRIFPNASIVIGVSQRLDVGALQEIDESGAQEFTVLVDDQR